MPEREKIPRRRYKRSPTNSLSMASAAANYSNVGKQMATLQKDDHESTPTSPNPCSAVLPDNLLVVYSRNDPIIPHGFRYIEVVKSALLYQRKVDKEKEDLNEDLERLPNNDKSLDLCKLLPNAWYLKRGGHCGSMLFYEDLPLWIDEWVCAKVFGKASQSTVGGKFERSRL